MRRRSISLTGLMLVVARALAACSPEPRSELPADAASATTAAPGQATTTATTVRRAAPTRPPAPETPGTGATTPLRQGTTQDSLGDPYYAHLGNGGYDVQYYALDLQVDPATNTVAGTATIAARATMQLPEVNLDFQGLEIQHIDVQHAPATYRRSQQEVTVVPASSVASGAPFTTMIRYRGQPSPVRSPSANMPMGWNNVNGYVFVVSEPVGASGWFPANAHPRDKATHSFRITVPEPYVAAANGLLRATTDNGETRTFDWETTSPMASYLATVNIGYFAVATEEGPDGLPIRNYFSEELPPTADDPFERTAEMIALFSSHFGPYPFEAYGVVVPNVRLGFALETQTLSVFGADMAAGGEENRTGRELVAAHEQQLSHDPPLTCQPDCHCWRSLSIALWYAPSAMLDWMREGHA